MFLCIALLSHDVIIAMCLWLYLEWPDRGALLCDAEGAEYRWSPGAEQPVAVCVLERWTWSTSGDLVCFKLIVVWLSLSLFFLFSSDFRRRFLSLLSYQFSSFHPSLALSILQNKKSKEETSSKTPLITNLIRFALHLTDLIWLVFHLHSSQ